MTPATVTPEVSLHEIAPRLARARDAWVAWNQQRRAFVIWQAHKVLELERLVAHRDLQLVRAYAVGNPAYIRRRERKLTWARAELARVQAMEPPR